MGSINIYSWKAHSIVIGLSFITTIVYGLDNGLARTPPMGFMTWQRYRCITDCKNYPDECISEGLIKRTADLMADLGYLEAGYEYLIIDDCWLSKNRSSEGNLQADPIRFPNGMRAVADYVHSKGLKFGIYEDFGDLTCGGYPGLYGHLQKDIQLLVSWGIDYIKIDGCNNFSFNADIFTTGYELLGKIMNLTDRPVVYSCSYPAYVSVLQLTEIQLQKLTENCNLWRFYGDIDDSWGTVTDILDYVANNQDVLNKIAGPGHWNDPDMLIIGNFGLSYEQSKAQMALWAVLAAPLLMSTDLSAVKPEYRRILLNKDVIQINQDPMGIPGRRVYKGVESESGYEVWTRKVLPMVNWQYSYAIALCNRRTDGVPYVFSKNLTTFGLENAQGYEIKDLYTGQTWPGIYKPHHLVTVRIPPSGIVFLKATVVYEG